MLSGDGGDRRVLANTAGLLRGEWGRVEGCAQPSRRFWELLHGHPETPRNPRTEDHAQWQGRHDTPWPFSPETSPTFPITVGHLVGWDQSALMRDWVGSLGIDLDSLQRTKALGDLCILWYFGTCCNPGAPKSRQSWVYVLVHVLGPHYSLSSLPGTSYLLQRSPAIHVKRLEGPLKHLPQICFLLKCWNSRIWIHVKKLPPATSGHIPQMSPAQHLHIWTQQFPVPKHVLPPPCLGSLCQVILRVGVFFMFWIQLGIMLGQFYCFSERIYTYLPVCNHICLSGVLTIFHPGRAIMLLSSNGLSGVAFSTLPQSELSKMQIWLHPSLPCLKPFSPHPPHLPYQVTETGSAHTPSPALLLQTLSALYIIPVLHWGWHHFEFLGSAGLFQSSVYVLVLAWVTFSVWISWQVLTHPSKPAQASPLWNLLWLSQGFLYATYSLGSPPDISFFIILY